ncbi:MAG TPA: copper amine oxidase N-terminal domain-containing protein [Caldisericia bacterium]|nr:copper amine oxidase N-terminal domain-containing protein [Caldisericia bacterium]
MRFFKILFIMISIFLCCISVINSEEIPEKIRIIMEIGNKTVNVNGVRKTLDVAPYLKEGRTMVPLRFIAEELKGEINWNNDTKTVNLIFDNPEYLKRVKETTEKFTVWISNPTKSSQTAILIYLPIKIDNNCFIRGSINFPDGTNAGVFEPNKFLPEEYLKKIMLNGKSILELKPPNTEKFGFINFGKENNPLIRFYFSTKEPVDELKLYLPSDLGMKFEKTGTFNILLKILTVESNDNWYETPFLESQKFTIFENLP